MDSARAPLRPDGLAERLRRPPRTDVALIEAGNDTDPPSLWLPAHRDRSNTPEAYRKEDYRHSPSTAAALGPVGIDLLSDADIVTDGINPEKRDRE